jgi:nucleoside-diphosphate-sugar epimerase
MPEVGPPGHSALAGRVLVTGCAGFLGSQVSEKLVAAGRQVLGIDCFTDYYARPLKEHNLDGLRSEPGFSLREVDLSADDLSGLLEGVSTVIHLAAQPGVRGSFGVGFETYVRNNVLATQRLLEEAARSSLTSFTYASSSSVYGDAATLPTSEKVDRRPVSPYGMTKVATEEVAAVYHRLFGLPVVGLRYFTAYGPRQRPDMAFTRFLTRALTGASLPVFGDGRQVREFTYVDDVVTATIAATERGVPGSVYNIGGGAPVELRHAIELIEEHVGRPLAIDRQPPQLGDARMTSCDGSLAERELGFVPSTRLADGIGAQLDWLRSTDRIRASVPELVHA